MWFERNESCPTCRESSKLSTEYYCPCCQSYFLEFESARQVKVFMKEVKNKGYVGKCGECKKEEVLEKEIEMEKEEKNRVGKMEKEGSVHGRKDSLEELRKVNPEM